MKKFGLFLLVVSIGLGLIAGCGTSQSSSNAPEDLYASNCATCHGADVKSSNLSGLTISSEEIQQTIKNGKGMMKGGLVSDAQAKKLADWLLTQ